MKNKIDFDESSHIYRVNEMKVPSVTQIIQDNFPVDFHCSPETLERARRFGEIFHKATELLDTNTLDPKSLDPALVNWMNTYNKFLLDYPHRVYASECMLFSRKHNFCGKLDRVIEMNDKEYAIVDYKTATTVSKTWRLQTAGYKLIWEQNKAIKITRRFCVQFFENDYKIIEHTDKTDETAFLACATLTNYRLNNGMKGKNESSR